MSTATGQIKTEQAPDMAAWEAAEKEKWDALHAHMTPQFEGVRAYVQHASARYRCAHVGNMLACYMPDPDQGEMHAMTGHSCSPEVRDFWRRNKNRNLKESEPELWEKMAEESDGLADALRKCGVHVIRNEKCEYPDGIINSNDAYRGPKFVSLYGGPPFARMCENVFCRTWECGPVRNYELSMRPGLMKLFDNNPDMRLFEMPYPEPDVNMRGPGNPGVDPAGYRLMPGKHILFGWGVPDAKHIPSTYDPATCNEHTSAGNPVGGKFMMRHLADYGFTSEEVYFDSNLSYHWDCIMMNMKEGFCGLPERDDWGLLSGELPKCLKDWTIIPIPLEEIGYGCANAPAIGDGRVLVDDRCKVTMERMSQAGLEPIPVKYSVCWDHFNSGMDCSDSEIWREDNPPAAALDALEKAQGVRAS